MDLTTRDARVEDAPALTRLLDALGYPAASDAVRRRLEALEASPSDRVLVAERQGIVVGLAGVHVSLSVEYDEPAAKLSALVVDPDHRRLGVGGALVRAVEAEAREHGCTLLFLTTSERRADAHSFYRTIGFEETGRRFAKRLR